MSVDENYDPQYLLAEVEEQYDTERAEHSPNDEDYYVEVAEEAYSRWLKDDWSEATPEHIAEMLNSPSVPEYWAERRLQDMSTGKNVFLSDEKLIALKGQLRTLGVGKTGGRTFSGKFGRPASPPGKGRQTHFGIMDIPAKKTKEPISFTKMKQAQEMPKNLTPKEASAQLVEKLLAPPVRFTDIERERQKIAKGEHGKAPPKAPGPIRFTDIEKHKKSSGKESPPKDTDDPSKDPAVRDYVKRAIDVIDKGTASSETASERLLLSSIIEKYQHSPSEAYKYTRDQLAKTKYMLSIRPSLRETTSSPVRFTDIERERQKIAKGEHGKAPPKAPGPIRFTDIEKQRRPRERGKH